MAEVQGMSSRQRWTLVLVCTATFMLLLDITVVSVALPSIQRDLHASLPDLQWVIDAYTLVLAVLLLPAAMAISLVVARPIPFCWIRRRAASRMRWRAGGGMSSSCGYCEPLDSRVSTHYTYE